MGYLNWVSVSLVYPCESEALDRRPCPQKLTPRIVFTGQGAQWPGMGRELIENYPVYKTSLVDSAATLKEFDTSWDLLSACNYYF